MKVAIVLPSGPIRDGVERAAFEAGCRWLVERGNELVLPEDVARVGEMPYLAGDDADRAGALARAGRAGADILWMGRGGYGGARTLAALARAALGDRDVVTSTPLWGFSDGTALLGHWVRERAPCWLAPPVVQIPRLDAPSHARLERALAEEVAAFDELAPIVPGRAEGPLSGGNLAVLASLVGTPHMPSLAGTILVLEDVGEVAYKVDRLLHQLLYAGAFEGVRGVVLGSFSGIAEHESRLVEALLLGFFARLGVVSASGLPVGHGARNGPLPLGRGWVAELMVETVARLTVTPDLRVVSLGEAP